MAEINKLSIRFDSKKFYRNLCDRLIGAVIKISVKLEMEMQFLAKSKTVRESIKSDISYSNYDLVDYGLNLIEAKVGSTAWKAFLENYGTGLKMNVVNNHPSFEKYYNSEYWNPLRRNSTAIVGREKGWYSTLDWDSSNPVKEVHRYSEGKYAGQNLEEIKMKMPNGGRISMASPQEGNDFMGVAFLRMESEFEKEAREVIASMNINNYLITGK